MATKEILQRTIWFTDQMRRACAPNASKLMARFNVSEAQAQRNITFMRKDLRIPMKYDAQIQGYRLLESNYALPTIWVNDEELMMMAMAQEVLQNEDFKKVWTTLFEKTVLISGTKAREIQRHIHYKSAGIYRSKPGILSRLLEAILGCHGCRIRYHSVFEQIPDHTVTLWPLHLVFYRSNWYLIALNKDRLRTYALARILEVDRLPEQRDHREYQEKILEILETPFGIFTTDEDGLLETVRLRFSPELTPYIETVILHPRQESEKCEDGGLILSFASFVTPELVAEILKYGPEVRVLSPDSLRERVVTALQKALKVYE
jgi:predicted DNA-binding transcriptional regulator YafY